MSNINIRLPADLSARLRSLAQRTGRSETTHMIEAIEEHLEDFEDLYVAETELNAVRTGTSKTTPLNVVINRYRLVV